MFFLFLFQLLGIVNPAMTLVDTMNPSLPVQSLVVNKLPTTTTMGPGEFKASRVCKPGVMKTNFDGKPNCLVIGDSIALG